MFEEIEAIEREVYLHESRKLRWYEKIYIGLWYSIGMIEGFFCGIFAVLTGKIKTLDDFKKYFENP